MAGLDVVLKAVDGDPTAAIAELSGVIDGTTVVKFQETLEETTKRGVKKLILDMAKVRYVNSTGLGSLVKYADKFKSAGGGMALARVTAKVKIVIEMLGLQAFFEICADERQALESLSRVRPVLPVPTLPPAAPPPPPRAVGPVEAPPHAPPPLAPAREAAGAPAPPARARPGAAAPAQVLACTSCGVEVEVPEAGNWKCPRCFTLIVVKPDGSVRFMAPDRPSPYELSLACSREGPEALKQFVGVLAQPVFPPPLVETVKAAVEEVAQVIAFTACGHDPKAVFHVSVETTPSEMRIRLADSGKTLDASRVEAYFPQAIRSMTEFECRPHPKGGNVIRMVRRR